MPNAEQLSFAYLEAHPADAARVMERLAPQEAAALLDTAPARLTAPVLRAMLPLHAARCLEPLEDATIAGQLRGVGLQASAAVLRYLPESRRPGVLAQLPTAMATAFSLLLGYSQNTVGGWMEPEALGFPADLRVGDATDRVRRSDRPVATLYVLDREQRLSGMVDLADLIRADADNTLAQIMRPCDHMVSAQSPLESVRDHPGWAAQWALPVVERGNRFVGVLRHTVVVRALKRPESKAGGRSEGMAAAAAAYWLSVSTLIDVVVGMLPVHTVAGGRVNDAKR